MDNCVKYVAENKIKDFFSILNQEKITYIIRNNINEEIPNHLIIGKDIDLLVKNEDMKLFDTLMKELNYDKGVYYDNRRFLYGLTDSFMYQNYDDDCGFRVHVFNQLSCKGLLPFWLPLDKDIQEYAWKNKIWNNINQWWELDINTRFIYMIVRCIFDKKIFSSGYIVDIEKLFPIIDMTIVKDFFQKIVINYTDRLLKLIKEKRYDEIVEDYLSFSDY